ncbi:putative enzyme related to lactoylglutathione lyase [Actinoalloteichus hoggarensis]|uniref:Glyoxalase-like domain protein n=1 Tax=Actinoalloteichus hoggarensis TaxID=1470176 RepID=A0A221W1U0_9PSEU|nr:VOC family protein [Actinoalloteichus hoggarensis]ASO19727.1 Glyoxalase-like domain protein [Actinoalloteichus hoggarensis]MBB5919567.1 putative enzyme related to lactoylglutathione lyase [Actinoalloteichus hoggarensis]
MSITGVQLFSVPVSDQDKALEFYVDKLGFELILDQDLGGRRWLQVAPKDSATSIVLVTWYPSLVPGSVRGLMLLTSDIDADCARLSEAGVPVDGPHDQPWGRQADITDPDGNVIGLTTPPPSWG